MQAENWLGHRIARSAKAQVGEVEQGLLTLVRVPRSIPGFKVCVQNINLYAFGDASKDCVCTTVCSIFHQSNGLSQGLLSSKVRLSKEDLIFPMPGRAACYMLDNLLDNAKKVLTGYLKDKLVE